MTDTPTPPTTEELQEWQALCDDPRLWCAPWSASTWEIDCPCPNGEHCGDTHSCETVEALEAYPNGKPGEPAAVGDGQCVVQIDVPGLDIFAKPNGAFIAAARSALPRLLAEVARLRAENRRLEDVADDGAHESMSLRRIVGVIDREHDALSVAATAPVMTPEEQVRAMAEAVREARQIARRSVGCWAPGVNEQADEDWRVVEAWPKEEKT